MLTCTKIYRDIPFAHRQHRHDGHCALIHGHNWSIELVLGCTEPDENGFVYDFGKLGMIRDWIAENLDHACVFSADDPLKKQLIGAAPAAWKIYELDNTSCEGLARHLFQVFDPMIRQASNDRAFLREITIGEDSKNAATWRPNLEPR